MLGQRELERVRAVVGRAHDLHTAVELEQCPNCCEEHRLVVDEQHADRSAGRQSAAKYGTWSTPPRAPSPAGKDDGPQPDFSASSALYVGSWIVIGPQQRWMSA